MVREMLVLFALVVLAAGQMIDPTRIDPRPSVDQRRTALNRRLVWHDSDEDGSWSLSWENIGYLPSLGQPGTLEQLAKEAPIIEKGGKVRVARAPRIPPNMPQLR